MEPILSLLDYNLDKAENIINNPDELNNIDDNQHNDFN